MGRWDGDRHSSGMSFTVTGAGSGGAVTQATHDEHTERSENEQRAPQPSPLGGYGHLLGGKEIGTRLRLFVAKRVHHR